METTGIQRLLKQIWPTVYRAVNNTIYFILNLIKSTVKMAIDEIKNG